MPPPELITVETKFTEFVQTFREGGPLSSFLGPIPPGALNADFYFPQDNVIAELKTLEVDALEPEGFNRRIMAAYKWLGYELRDYVDWLRREKNFPDDVSRRLLSTIERPVADCVKKAHKQITSSRSLLGRKDTNGLILIANSSNFGFPPMQIMTTICKAFERLRNREQDAVVYFTPNVYHDLGHEVPYELWVPIANEGGEGLQGFIDDLGKAWFDYGEANWRSSTTRKSGNDLIPLLNAKVKTDWDD